MISYTILHIIRRKRNTHFQCQIPWANLAKMSVIISSKQMGPNSCSIKCEVKIIKEILLLSQNNNIATEIIFSNSFSNRRQFLQMQIKVFKKMLLCSFGSNLIIPDLIQYRMSWCSNVWIVTMTQLSVEMIQVQHQTLFGIIRNKYYLHSDFLKFLIMYGNNFTGIGPIFNYEKN